MRQLTAIMFTDLVGFTSLMQEDEERAKAVIDRHREVLQRCVGRYGGRTLQFYGDGTLSVFPSAVNAAGAAVAARIQGLGVAGSVLLSAKVHDELKNHAEIRARPLGEFDLKNVKQPLAILAVVAEGLTVPRPEEMPSAQETRRKSVAVLPFVNRSSDPENEFFSDGITEDVINVLTRIDAIVKALRVHLGQLGQDPRTRVTSGESRDGKAYTEYLRGLHHFNRWTPEGARESIRSFEGAFELDEEWGAPLAMKAGALIFLGAIGHQPAADVYPEAEASGQSEHWTKRSRSSRPLTTWIPFPSRS